MKMAKASEADLRMAMDLSNALDLLGQRWLPCMPEAIEQLEGDDESERFDREDDAQCGRALRHLLEIAERGSLMRVIWGMAVLLDPANRIVDPDADTLERHPDTPAAPNMFWNADSPEDCAASSVHEVLERDWCDGVLQVGHERVIQRAVRQSDVRVRVVSLDEDAGGIDWEEIPSTDGGAS